MSVPDFGQIRRRLEQLGADLSTSLYSINLSTQDSETGQYGTYYILSSIDAIIQPNSAAVQNTAIGYYPEHIATIYTDTSLSEGDIIKDAASDYYTVKTVSPIEVGDGTILYEGELTKRLIGVYCPTGEYVTNGGFETGDFTGWTNNGTAISGVSHSGSYSAVFSVGDSISQTLITPIPSECASVTLWIKVLGCFYVTMKLTLTYTDSTTTIIEDGVPTTDWSQSDFSSYLENGKILSAIKIECTAISSATPYIDDISVSGSGALL